MFPFRSGRVGSDGVGCGVYSVVCLMLDVEGVGIGGVACDYSCRLKGTLTKIFPTKSVLAKYYSSRKQ